MTCTSALIILSDRVGNAEWVEISDENFSMSMIAAPPNEAVRAALRVSAQRTRNHINAAGSYVIFLILACFAGIGLAIALA